MSIPRHWAKSNMAAREIENLRSVISSFQALVDNPEVYLNPSDSLSKDTAHAVKVLFDFAKRDELQGGRHATTCPLQQLLVDNFDDEQIWQEIELQNEPVLSSLATEVSGLERKKRKIHVLRSKRVSENHPESNGANRRLRENERQHSLEKQSNNDEAVGEDQDIFSEEEIAGDHSESDEDMEEEITQDTLRKSTQSSVVDDKFFKLADMLEFLNREDRKHERTRSGRKENAAKNSNHDNDDDDGAEEEEEFVDLFADIDSEDQEDDSEDWDDAVEATAKLMGRNQLSNKRPHLKTKSAGELKYADFFDPPEEEKPTKRRKQMQEDSSEEESNAGDQGLFGDKLDVGDQEGDIIQERGEDDDSAKEENISTFEKNQLKLKEKIEKLEKANLASKPWQMSGETTSKVRPINSLLAEDLEFDHTTVAAPAITEETTQDLESMVTQRIKDEAWDDVERKTKPVTEPYEYKKRQPLDQEKSKLSLSQVYEQEYLKQTQDEAEEKENEEHTAIKALMSKLFVKLDALSNFHFTPKPVKPELKIVTNAPAISMEEVAPVAVSDAMLLAPEEIQEKKADVKGDTEKTATDRKHDRRLKKKKQRMRAKEKEQRKKLIEKTKPGLGNKHSKQAALAKLEKETKSGSGNVSVIKEGSKSRKDLATSSAFFTRLQDEVQAQIKTKTESRKNKKKGERMSAPRLKL